MKPRTRWILLALAAVLLAGGIYLLARPAGEQSEGTELLQNGDCEAQDQAWSTGAWITTEGYTEFSWTEEGEGYEGGRALHIRNRYLNDARFYQDIGTQPDSVYRISGRIRAACEEGMGANLSVEGVVAYSEAFYDTEGEWKDAVLYIQTGPDQHRVRIYVRLGGYSGEAVGEAWFDDLSAVKLSTLPAGVTVQAAYTASQSGEKSGGQKTGAWKMILACFACLLLFLGLCVLAGREREDHSLKEETEVVTALLFGAVMLLGFLVRCVFAVRISGYDVDINDFRIWATRAAEVGPAGFYAESSFCDYPPGYILVLWFVGLLGRIAGGVSVFLVKLPAIAADLLTAFLLFREARRRDLGPVRQWGAAALYLFSPLTVLISACWGQCDAVLTVLLILTVLWAVRGKWRFALPCYMLAVLMKPQALMFGPLGLLALAVEAVRAFRSADEAVRKAFFRDLLWGAGAMLGVFALVVLPFSFGQGGLGWIFALYAGTMSSYGQVTVNACNLYYLLGLNWAGTELLISLFRAALAALLAGLPWGILALRAKERRDRIAGGVLFLLPFVILGGLRICGSGDYGTAGIGLIVCTLLAAAYCYLRGGQIRHLPLCGAAALIGIFNLGCMMHERYLFPALALLLLAAMLEKDWRAAAMGVLTSLAGFLNCACVLDRNLRIGGASGHLKAPMFGIASDLAKVEALSAVLVIACGIGLSLLMADKCILRSGERVLRAARELQPAQADAAGRIRERVLAEDAPKKGWLTWKDWAWMLIGCVLFSVLTFVDLGSVKAPQTGFVFRDGGESVTLDLGEEKDFRLLYYQGIHQSNSGFSVAVAGEDQVFGNSATGKVDPGDCFKWSYIIASGSYSQPMEFSGRYVRITADTPGVTLFELLARDGEGNVYPFTAGSADAAMLCDEPDSLEGEPGWYNSAYFDEIYHARTAYEIREGMSIYEWTHPPLGKLMMSWAVGIFGMTPFGWRFAGALMGVLMLPAMYLLGRILFKKRFFAVGVMGLMFLDCMHFTQTRIATIDSFVTCFILWSVFFMIYWFRMDLWRTSLLRSLVPLALSGFFVACAIASKWIGCYCGVGLAVTFFWGLYRRIREVRWAGKQAGAREDAVAAAAAGGRKLMITVGCCFLFFIALPLMIYYISYIPVLRNELSVSRLIQECRNMLDYHGEPGRGMDHPYYSPWYQWPLIIKPMYYAAAHYVPKGMGISIWAMGNPAVWWVGALAVLVSAGLVIRNHLTLQGPTLLSRDRDTAPALILIGVLAQYLPWMLVPRGTYIYHYFAVLPFTILANGYLWSLMEEKYPKWGKTFMAAQLGLALILFVGFFPFASGVAAPIDWMQSMIWFPNWLYFNRG